MVSLGLFCGFSGLAVLLEFIMGLKIKIKRKRKKKEKEKEKEKMIVMGIWSQNRQRKRLLGVRLANLLWSQESVWEIETTEFSFQLGSLLQIFKEVPWSVKGSGLSKWEVNGENHCGNI